MPKQRLKNGLTALLVWGILVLSVPAAIMAQDRPANPEEPTKNTVRKLEHPQIASTREAMVVTAHPLATDAAFEILVSGGNAVDAAVAAQLVLGLVEPQSSGLGGGAFVLYYNSRDKTLYSFDGRETAPEKADENLFIRNGHPMGFWEAVIGGRAVGTPGTPKLLDKLHTRFGQKEWKSLFDPALKLAGQGFEVTPRLARLIEKDKDRLSRYEKTRQYFFKKDGTPYQAGDILKNRDYAETLRLFRSQGEVTFYRGALAHEIIAAVRRVPDNKGYLGLNDLKAYDIIQRPNLCAPYRQYTVCSMGEPSSGGLTLLQILGMLEGFDLGNKPNADAIHLIIEASRLAFADRNFYMADPDFVDTPGAHLLTPEYLQRRSRLISENRRMTNAQVTPGIPPNWLDKKRAADTSIKPPGTTHISIKDRDGNLVSMTSTIEQAFGSRVMTNGFLLNNELTDFSFVPKKNGWPVANRVEGGKRPRSSMAPTIVFHPDGSPYLIIGSAGGSRIIGYVLKSLIHIIDWKSSVETALKSPHFLSRGHGIEMEPGLEEFHARLKSLGHSVKTGEMNSGLTAIKIDEGLQITGSADPRREGKPAGL